MVAAPNGHDVEQQGEKAFAKDTFKKILG